MNEQEMQFADPDWQPSQPLNTLSDAQEKEQYTPEPINVPPREQTESKATMPPPPYREGYKGPGPQFVPLPPQGSYMDPAPYGGSASQQMPGTQFRPRQYRRRRGPWLWIILALIIFGLMSGGFGSFNRFGQRGLVDTRNFTVGAHPIIVITDTNGNIRIHKGGSANSVTVQAMKEGNWFGNSNDTRVIFDQIATDTIKVSLGNQEVRGVDFDVTVPSNADLKLTTNSGEINVDGVSGKMSLSTNDGSISAINDTLSGDSTLTSTNGSISFGGFIGSTGTYTFKTSDGSINVTLPKTTPFHVDASTSSGSINTDFSEVPVQKNDPGSTAQGNVGGGSPTATVILHSDNGSINVHQGP